MKIAAADAAKMDYEQAGVCAHSRVDACFSYFHGLAPLVFVSGGEIEGVGHLAVGHPDARTGGMDRREGDVVALDKGVDAGGGDDVVDFGVAEAERCRFFAELGHVVSVLA